MEDKLKKGNFAQIRDRFMNMGGLFQNSNAKMNHHRVMSRDKVVVKEEEYFPHVYPEFEKVYNKQELRHLEKLFLKADHDRDGFLNAFEIRYFMEKLGQPISQGEFREILLTVDEDKDGLLSFREFLLLCKIVRTDQPNSGEISLKMKNKLSPIVKELSNLSKIGSEKIRNNLEFFENQIQKESPPQPLENFIKMQPHPQIIIAPAPIKPQPLQQPLPAQIVPIKCVSKGLIIEENGEVGVVVNIPLTKSYPIRRASSSRIILQQQSQHSQPQKNLQNSPPFQVQEAVIDNNNNNSSPPSENKDNEKECKRVASGIPVVKRPPIITQPPTPKRRKNTPGGWCKVYSVQSGGFNKTGNEDSSNNPKILGISPQSNLRPSQVNATRKSGNQEPQFAFSSCGNIASKEIKKMALTKAGNGKLAFNQVRKQFSEKNLNAKIPVQTIKKEKGVFGNPAKNLENKIKSKSKEKVKESTVEVVFVKENMPSESDQLLKDKDEDSFVMLENKDKANNNPVEFYETKNENEIPSSPSTIIQNFQKSLKNLISVAQVCLKNTNTSEGIEAAKESQPKNVND